MVIMLSVKYLSKYCSHYYVQCINEYPNLFIPISLITSKCHKYYPIINTEICCQHNLKFSINDKNKIFHVVLDLSSMDIHNESGDNHELHH
jgi:hypothetical protein